MTHCPQCRTDVVGLAPQDGLVERVLGWLTIYPHRCQFCGHRFLAFHGHPCPIPQRNFTRVQVECRGEIRSPFLKQDVPPLPGRIVNLSIGGCRLDGQPDLPEGARLRLEFDPGDLDPDGFGTPVVIEEAIVCSRAGRGLGLKFTRIGPLEQRRIGRIIHELLCPTRSHHRELKGVVAFPAWGVPR